MSIRVRDLVVLAVMALAARAIAVAVVPWPPYTDPAYYSLVAQRLADGHGFTTPVLWSFIEVGSVLPDPAILPVPSNAHWLPLTSFVAAASMAVFGSQYVAGTLPLILLSALLVPFTYAVAWELAGIRWQAAAAAVLALFAGPLLIMYPTIDNFAVFGALGAGALWCAMNAIRVARPGPWLVSAGGLAGLATLSRIDGVLLTVGVAAAWFVRRGWSPWRPTTGVGGASVAWGFASAAAFLLVLAPWAWRNLQTFGSVLPSAGGHTLWIRSYNEQFSIGSEVSFATFLDWGVVNIAVSRLVAWSELIGRTGVLLGGTFLVFFVAGLWIFRRRADLAPFYVYFVVMFVAMGAIFTFHSPRGAFYHSSPAWLPWAYSIAIAAVAPASTAAGRIWPFLRRPETHRFLTLAGIAGALVLSMVGSSVLYVQWDRSRQRDEQVAAFLRDHAEPHDVVMASDPASLYPLTGLAGVSAPFDRFEVIARVVDVYDVRWVVVLSPGNDEPDPLSMWEGAEGVDSTGESPAFLPSQPAFEGDSVRVYEVRDVGE